MAVDSWEYPVYWDKCFGRFDGKMHQQIQQIALAEVFFFRGWYIDIREMSLASDTGIMESNR